MSSGWTTKHATFASILTYKIIQARYGSKVSHPNPHIKIGHNTWLLKLSHWLMGRPPFYAIKLYETEIIKYFSSGFIQLNTDGWCTILTRSRLNQLLPAWNVYTTGKNRQILEHPKRNHTVIFEDNMIVHVDGRYLYEDEIYSEILE